MSDKSLSLYKITDTLKQIGQEIIQSGGEVTEKQEEMLLQLQEELLTKTDNVVHWVNSIESQIKLAKEEQLRIKEIEAQLSKGLSKFNEYVLSCMDTLNKVELKGDLRTIKIRKPSVKVDIFNEDDIPLEYIKSETKTITSVNKKLLKDHLKNGDNIPGARLMNGDRNLIIK